VGAARDLEFRQFKIKYCYIFTEVCAFVRSAHRLFRSTQKFFTLTEAFRVCPTVLRVAAVVSSPVADKSADNCQVKPPSALPF